MSYLLYLNAEEWNAVFPFVLSYVTTAAWLIGSSCMGKLPCKLPALSYPGAAVFGGFPDDIACKPQPISSGFCLAFVTFIYIHLEEVVICIRMSVFLKPFCH